MNNSDSETSADVVFEYTGDGCSVPKDVTSVLFKEGLQKIGYGAFMGCTELESITIPSTVTEIDILAFHDCSNLEEVTLNEGLQKIGEAAFYKCTSLEDVALPSTVTEIDDDAFFGCSNLREVELNGVPQYFDNEAFLICDVLEKILFPTISYSLVNIIQTGHWEDLEDKLNDVRGVVQWESNRLFVSRATFHTWNETKRDIGRIARLVSYYELKEATSTFELALWKSKLDQVGATNTTNRAAYRIDVPGPVKDRMLQYLGHSRH